MQLRHISLEVPLAPFLLGGNLQRHHPCPARVQMLGEPLDRAALASRVPALEQHHDPAAGLLDPVLQLEQLHLQQPFDLLVGVPVQALGRQIHLQSPELAAFTQSSPS
jgi:hypothetical protein